MAKKLSDYRSKIKGLVKDAGILAYPADYDDGLDRALEWYSQKRPRTEVIDLPSDGSGDFPTSSLPGFDEEFSGDPEIEYPITTSDDENLVDRREWRFVRKPAPAGLTIRLSDKPPAGDQVRFAFKAPHLIPTALDGTNDPNGALTVTVNDFNAVCNYAAAELCDDLARHFTPTSEHTAIEADIADYTSKGKEYEQRAKVLRAKAREHVGENEKEDSGPPAASRTKNWDLRSSTGGDRITHPRRLR